MTHNGVIPDDILVRISAWAATFRLAPFLLFSAIMLCIFHNVRRAFKWG